MGPEKKLEKGTFSWPRSAEPDAVKLRLTPEALAMLTDGIDLRHGLTIPRQTMARWMAMAVDWLRPLWREIKTTVMDVGYVQIDETPVRYLEPGHGKTKRSYLWIAHRPGGDTVFHWHTSRGAACLEAMVPGKWSGVIQ